jgi:uncharacterized membrane protein
MADELQPQHQQLADPEHGLEMAMGRILQIGVTVAAIVVLAGGILYLKASPGPRPDYTAFHGAPANLTTMHGIFAGLAHLDPASIIAFGILLLVATPVCRVLFGVVGFALIKDKFYAAVSAVVLAILLYSFVFRQ